MRSERTTDKPTVAIVDYGLGNLYSIMHACLQAGLEPIVTSSGKDLAKSDAVLLPGVGAFGVAMESLEKLDLAGPIKESAEAGKPLLGICLGMQLLMEESDEFGSHKGLGIVKGVVRKLSGRSGSSKLLKVPHVGWNRVCRPGAEDDGNDSKNSNGWSDSLLRGITNGEYMYFVHSFHVVPSDSSVVLSLTRYGEETFCSSLSQDAIFATQFHPERSGRMGLQLYRNLKDVLVSET